MSLQLHTENTIIDFYLITEEGNKQKASVSLVKHHEETGTVELLVRENGTDRPIVCYYDQDFIINVTGECEHYEVRCRAYLNQQDGRVWLSLDAPRNAVHIGRHKAVSTASVGFD